MGFGELIQRPNVFNKILPGAVWPQVLERAPLRYEVMSAVINDQVKLTFNLNRGAVASIPCHLVQNRDLFGRCPLKQINSSNLCIAVIQPCRNTCPSIYADLKYSFRLQSPIYPVIAVAVAFVAVVFVKAPPKRRTLIVPVQLLSRTGTVPVKKEITSGTLKRRSAKARKSERLRLSPPPHVA